ncbi:MAG: S1 family peptidase [Myxococcota bacterium]
MFALLTTVALAQDPGTYGAWDDLPAPGLTDEPEAPAPIINGQLGNGRTLREAGGLIIEASLSLPGPYPPVRARLLWCSATLIAPDVVMTAAHCVDVDGLLQEGADQGVEALALEDLSFTFAPAVDLTPHQFEFDLFGGFTDLPASSMPGAAWVAHEGFDVSELELGLGENADIALVFLAEPTEREFALLPTPEEGEALAVDDDVVIVGWGQQSQDGIAGTKQVADSFISELGPFELKVGEVATDGRKCHGDSGGPTFRDFGGPPSHPDRVIGVTSHAYDLTDCQFTGGVDTRVDAYLDWIDAQMRQACEDGVRSWCLEEGIIAPPDEDGLFSWEQPIDDPDGPNDGEGCGCGTSPAPGLLGLLLVPWLFGRRSHRDRALAEA